MVGSLAALHAFAYEMNSEVPDPLCLFISDDSWTYEGDGGEVSTRTAQAYSATSRLKLLVFFLPKRSSS